MSSAASFFAALRGRLRWRRAVFAVRRKLVHQVLVPADVNAAAFPFADGKLQIDLQRDPIVAQGDLIGEILLEFITELTGNEVDNGELRLLHQRALFAL